MKLHTYWRSSAAYRVRIALAFKCLESEMVAINLARREQWNSEYAAVNPQSIVPTLQDNGLTIGQSVAIFEYLEETYPTPSLLPEDPGGRARVRSVAQAVACEMHPRLASRTRDYITSKFTSSERDEWYAHWANQGLNMLEDWLSKDPSTGKFCHGDTPTMADCFLVPQLYAAKRYDFLDLEAFPTLMSIDSQCTRHQAFQKAAPNKQHDMAADCRP